MFVHDDFTITTDELSLVTALDEDSEINPTEWFDPQQMWEFLLYVVDPQVLPNTPRFETSRERLSPIAPSIAEFPRCEKTLDRETNMRICLLAYKQLVELIKDREYWYHQYIVTPAYLQATNWKKLHQRENDLAALLLREAWKLYNRLALICKSEPPCDESRTSLRLRSSA